jgi:PKD repeat protein
MRHAFALAGCALLTLAGCGGGPTNSTNPPPANQPPVANAGGPYSGTVGVPVSLTGAASTDPQGQALTYAWDFGDKTTTGTGVAPSHTYTAAGTYTVSLTVTDTSGLTGTATAKATIAAAPQPPVANAGGPYSGTIGVPVSLTGAASTDPQGQTLTYAWDFGDKTATGTGVAPSHTYTAAGIYTVSLTVTDTGGLTGTATVKATIAAPGRNSPLHRCHPGYRIRSRRFDQPIHRHWHLFRRHIEKHLRLGNLDFENLFICDDQHRWRCNHPCRRNNHNYGKPREPSPEAQH